MPQNSHIIDILLLLLISFPVVAFIFFCYTMSLGQYVFSLICHQFLYFHTRLLIESKLTLLNKQNGHVSVMKKYLAFILNVEKHRINIIVIIFS